VIRRVSIEVYKCVRLIKIGYFTSNLKIETKEVRNMNLILCNAWMYVKMNKLLLIMILTVFLGAFLAPVDGGTCVCTCSLTIAGSSTVSCSSCTTSYCSSKYSSCLGASVIGAACSGAALPTPVASVMVVSLLTLFFFV